MLDPVREFFLKDQWPFSQVEDQPALRTSFRGQNGQWSCLVHARADYQQLVVYAFCPVHAPAERRPAVAEFITRANYGLVMGNLELDFEDGEIRCKTSLDVTGDRLTPALVKQLVYANMVVMDKYLPGLMAVIYSNASPVEAIAQVESDQ
jgi:hypothetical protein